tara:strand:- start:87 stop:296 length:210 start_codon:yes stop_codon:yes gene_type:complete
VSPSLYIHWVGECTWGAELELAVNDYNLMAGSGNERLSVYRNCHYNGRKSPLQEVPLQEMNNATLIAVQ